MTTRRQNKLKQVTVVDVLKRMRVLLRKGWTQGTLARGVSKCPVNYSGRAARSFCLMGARERAQQDLKVGHSLSYEAELLIVDCAGGNDVAFNDAKGRKKSEIIAVVDCAIKQAASK